MNWKSNYKRTINFLNFICYIIFFVLFFQFISYDLKLEYLKFISFNAIVLNFLMTVMFLVMFAKSVEIIQNLRKQLYKLNNFSDIWKKQNISCIMKIIFFTSVSTFFSINAFLLTGVSNINIILITLVTFMIVSSIFVISTFIYLKIMIKKIKNSNYQFDFTEINITDYISFDIENIIFGINNVFEIIEHNFEKQTYSTLLMFKNEVIPFINYKKSLIIKLKNKLVTPPCNFYF